MPYFKLPRFSKAAGKPLNRSDFMKGRYKAYFAPGQTPNVLSQYAKPAAWRPSGSILTPPQVVWFTLAPIQGPYGQTFTNGVYAEWATVAQSPPANVASPGELVTITFSTYFADGFVLNQAVTFNQPSGLAGDGPTNLTAYPAPQSKYSYPLYPSGYQPTGNAINNPIWASIFGGSLSLIRNDQTDPPSQPQGTNPLLPGYNPAWNPTAYPSLTAWWASCASQLTTVYSQTVDDIISDENDRLTTIFTEVITQLKVIRKGKTWGRLNNISIAGLLNGEVYSFSPCLSMEISPTAKPKFFGVDFLHIHALCVSAEGQLPNNGWQTYQENNSAASEAQLMAAYSQFFRYRCQVYGPDGQFDLFPPAPHISNAYPNAPGGVDSGALATPFATPVVDNILGTANNPNVQTINDNRDFTINTQNTYLQSLIPGTNGFLSGEAATVKKYGVRYSGTQSQLQSAGQVMSLVAARFGFDPDTGDDLPLQ